MSNPNMVRDFIDMVEHSDAYRVVHYIPLWCFFGVDTKEHAKEFSNDIIKNVGFWSWFINQEPSLKKKRDISLAKGIYNASR